MFNTNLFVFNTIIIYLSDVNPFDLELYESFFFALIETGQWIFRSQYVVLISDLIVISYITQKENYQKF